jgi:hypothetical protein
VKSYSVNLELEARRTNRWTGATGSEFRIKRDPAELLGSAVARSTQTFGACSVETMTLAQLRDRSRWWCLVFGLLFLVINIEMRVIVVFASGNDGGMLLLISLGAVILSLILGILALPRWQGFVALGIFAYAVYWLTFYDAYAVA